MNLELYIAQRLRTGNKDNKISAPSVRIATAGIALGLAVMILAVAIITGFKNEVKSKVTGFAAHIRVSNFDSNQSFESIPILKDSSFIAKLYANPDIRSVQSYATKPGMIHHKDQIQGIILKGQDLSFDADFISQHIIDGKVCHFGTAQRNDSVIISKAIADAMHLNTGDKFKVYFIKDKIRVRVFKVAGIYKTDLADFDKTFIFCDLRHIQKLNNWDSNQVSGYELLLHDFDELDRVAYETYLVSANHLDQDGSSMISKSIKELYPEIFGWLDIIDINVWIILFLMLLVSGINMISGVLILILEKSKTIGILKAMGKPDWNIRKVFLYLSTFLVSRGMLWGNLIAIGIALLQQHFSIIPLDPANYYVDAVPINLKISHLLLLNIGTLITISLMMLIPSYLITKITPIKTIQFD